MLYVFFLSLSLDKKREKLITNLVMQTIIVMHGKLTVREEYFEFQRSPTDSCWP